MKPPAAAIAGHVIWGTDNQVWALWAATTLEGILTAAEKQHLISRLLEKQRDDGGWRLFVHRRPFSLHQSKCLTIKETETTC